MTRKLLIAVLTLMASVLLTTNVFGQACTGTPAVNPIFVGVGSSAQTNTLAYAAINQTTGGTFSGYSLWTSGSGQLQDTRFSPAVVDTGLTVWVVYKDNTTTHTCDLYAYFQEDSTIGVRDFFATNKVANVLTSGVGVFQAVYGNPGTWTSAAGANKIPGLADTVTLPSAVISYLTTSPAPTTRTPKQPLPQPYCGQTGTSASGTSVYCFFNAGATDIRPEDALFATTRALSAYNTTNGLAGLGYGQIGAAGCGAVSATEGCLITDSFQQSKSFAVLSFKITGTDPVTLATVPSYSTLSTGVAPIVVFVSNHDTGSLGFGSTYVKNGTHYTFTNINHKLLADVFDGTTNCTGDLLPGQPSATNSVYNNGFVAGPPASAGSPIQVVLREPLSGTYNTFEYTGVRTLKGSAAAAIKESAVSTKTWLSNDDSGQELDINPATNYLDAHCSPIPDGSKTCGNPTWIATPSHPNAGNSACGAGLRARAIGTGEEVSATLGKFNSTTSALSPGWSVDDGIGYSFWSYGNFAAAATTGSTPGHYLTVDGIDPLFITEGGEFDSQYGQPNNPNGAFNLPQCNFSALPCTQLPFTHVINGDYPLWSQLRLVTFSNKTGQVTPAGVINMVGYAETEATDNRFNLSDFAPLLSGVTGLPYTQGGALPTGSLNVGVFRSHYFQSAVNPKNAHTLAGGCPTTFTGISIQGGTGTTGTGACLVDQGGDVGGSIMTVRQDFDFNKDIGTTTNTPPNPLELLGLHQ